MLLSRDWLRFWICVFSTNHIAKARGNAVDKVTIFLSFATDWVREWRDFFWSNHRDTRQNRCNREFLLTCT